MENQFIRTQLLLGEAGMQRLARARVAVFGIGGVGGHTAEALARSGVGTLDLIDNDTVCVSNLNRQIIATYETIGMDKTDAAKERIRQISPGTAVNVHKTFFLPETADQFDFSCYDYVVDAIDTVTGKLEIILRAQAAGVPVISCMGAGNKLDATAFRVADIYETSGCPLARVMRRELKKRGVKKCKVVYSTENALTPIDNTGAETKGSCSRPAPGSVAFVPAVAGLIAAGEVIRDLTGHNRR